MVYDYYEYCIIQYVGVAWHLVYQISVDWELETELVSELEVELDLKMKKSVKTINTSAQEWRFYRLTFLGSFLNLCPDIRR